MTSDEIREAFLSYFEGKGHLRVASSSLIPVGDPTLLMTTAGMVQFKPYFSGESTPSNRRLTSAQKSFRTVDIDEVGDATHLTLFEMLGNFSIGDYFKKEAIDFALEFVTKVLGLPKERWYATIYLDDDESHELWRQAGIPEERIYRFGDEDNWWGPAGLEGPCGPCSELHYDFGPGRGCGNDGCAPNCTRVMNEVGDACNRFVEVWNLVFMQYYHHLDGSRPPLPAPSVDTGLGLERAAIILQDVDTIYETDLFVPAIRRVEELSGKTYGADHETDYAMRVVAEHGRSSTFLIADGVVPGNEGRGYVLRRVVRRAIRHGRHLGMEEAFLGEVAGAFIEQMGAVYPELRNHQDFILTVLKLEEERFQRAFTTGIGIFDHSLKGWRDQMREAITQQFESEFRTALAERDVINVFYGVQAAAEKFMRAAHSMHVLASGERDAIAEAQEKVLQHVKALHSAAKARQTSSLTQTHPEFLSELRHHFDSAIAAFEEVSEQIQGFEAFILWDSYGFPVEETDAIAREAGLVNGVDLEGYQREMEAQRERGRATAQFGGDRAKIRVYEGLGIGATQFLGYEQLTASSVVVGLISDGQAVSELSEDQDAEVLLVETPFYAEGGGQVGDAGELVGPNGNIRVHDTQTVMPDVIVHFGKVTQGSVAMGDTIEAYVDPVRREDTARNHTATHLLHAALRQVLGAHVRQAGSLVAPNRLRFDFTHVKPMTDDEVWQVQLLVNEKIRQNAKVLKDEDSYTAAIQRGALAFFGDKYGDEVRLIEIANGATFSFEVCGGTHVQQTGEVGAVYILGESSIGAGMRRLEAISGRAAEKAVWERFNREDRLVRKLQTTGPDLEDRVQSLLDELDGVRREKEALERRLSLQAAEGLLESRQDVNGVTVLAARVSASNVDSMREIGDWLRDKLGSGVVVLGSVINDQPTINVSVTSDLVRDGIDARDLAKGLGKAIGGGGGGRAEMAQAGGRQADKLDEALGLARELVKNKSAAC